MIVNDIDEEELKKPSVHSDMRVHADAEGSSGTAGPGSGPRFGRGRGNLPESVSRPGSRQVFDGGEGPQGYDMEQNLRHVEGEISCYTAQNTLTCTDEEPANVYAFIHAVSSRLRERAGDGGGQWLPPVGGDTPISLRRASVSSPIPPFASMGYDLPAAIGAWTASRDKGLLQPRRGQKRGGT